MSYNTSPSSNDVPAEEEKRQQWHAFLFIIIALFPILSVAIVGGYGLIIWISQMIFGPPGIS